MTDPERSQENPLRSNLIVNEEYIKRLISIAGFEDMPVEEFEAIDPGVFVEREPERALQIDTAQKEIKYIKENDNSQPPEIQVPEGRALIVKELCAQLNISDDRSEFISFIRSSGPALDTGYFVGRKPGGDKNPWPMDASEFTVVAAPTGNCKTTMSVNLMLSMAEKYPTEKFLFITLEESSGAIHKRLLNCFSSRRLKACTGNDNYFSSNNMGTIDDFYSTDEFTLQYVSEKDDLRRDNKSHFKSFEQEYWNDYVKTGRIKVLYANAPVEALCEVIAINHSKAAFIDYIQLLNTEESLENSKMERRSALRSACVALKEFTSKANIPIIATAQTTREVTDRNSMQLNKIADCADIERFAGSAVFLLIGEEGLDVKILKNRSGVTGTFTTMDFYGNESVIMNKIDE